MNLTRNQIIIIGISGLVILILALLFLGVIPGIKKSSGPSGLGKEEKNVVAFWGVADEKTVEEAIEEYQKTNKGVEINYARFAIADYEKQLINALAAGRGPDIFMIHNAWLPKHYDKTIPLTESQFPLSQFRQLFPAVAEQNFIRQSQDEENTKIYALPLSIDTLALFYNKDVFDAKGIALPPTNWEEFQKLIPKLREINPQTNEIKQAAAAIGGSETNINQASDLLSLLMLQSGALMINPESGRADFGNQGLNALNFYIQFAQSSNANYTWNNKLLYSLDSFASGDTAIIFNYAFQIPYLKSKNPFLNFGIAAMPQLNPRQPINYASYWGLTVSNQSRRPDLAWNFIFNLTVDPQASEKYLKSSGLPPSLRVLIQRYADDSALGVFSRQALTARSWYQADSSAIKQIFSNMIDSILNGKLAPEYALKQAENEIGDLQRN